MMFYYNQVVNLDLADADINFITKNINLNIPLLSATMDIDTEHKLAINKAQLSGIDVLHKTLVLVILKYKKLKIWAEWSLILLL